MFPIGIIFKNCSRVVPRIIVESYKHLSPGYAKKFIPNLLQITPVIFLVIPLDLSLFFQIVILGFIQDIPQALLQRVLHVAYAVISPEASQ